MSSLLPLKRRRDAKGPKSEAEELEGGKFIGRGSFGCTYSPPLATQGSDVPPDPRSWLGKVMTKKNADEEIARMAFLRKIDPKQRFGLYSVFRKPQKLARSVPAVVTSAGGVKQLAKCTDVSGFEGSDVLHRNGASDLRQILLPKASSGDLTKVMKLVEEARTKTASAAAADVAAASAPNYGRLLLKHMRAMLVLFDGLVFYHSKGLVHTDIKPSNVVLASGTWRAPLSYKYIDFGLVERVFLSVKMDESKWGIGGTPIFIPLASFSFLEDASPMQLESEARSLAGAGYPWFPQALKVYSRMMLLKDSVDTAVIAYADERSRSRDGSTSSLSSSSSSSAGSGSGSGTESKTKLNANEALYVAFKKYADVFALTLTFVGMYAAIAHVVFGDKADIRSTGAYERQPHLATSAGEDPWRDVLHGGNKGWVAFHNQVSKFVDAVLCGAICDAERAASAYRALLGTLRTLVEPPSKSQRKSVKLSKMGRGEPDAGSLASESASDSEDDDDDGSSSSDSSSSGSSGDTSDAYDASDLKQDLAPDEDVDPDADNDDEEILKQKEQLRLDFVKKVRVNSRAARKARREKKLKDKGGTPPATSASASASPNPSSGAIESLSSATTNALDSRRNSRSREQSHTRTHSHTRSRSTSTSADETRVRSSSRLRSRSKSKSRSNSKTKFDLALAVRERERVPEPKPRPERVAASASVPSHRSSRASSTRSSSRGRHTPAKHASISFPVPAAQAATTTATGNVTGTSEAACVCVPKAAGVSSGPQFHMDIRLTR